MDPYVEKDKKWYQLAFEDALHQMGSFPEGLTSSESALRLEKYGPNKLGDEQPTSRLKVF
ncbi:protein containing ATPase, P-type cation-transporter, N-terminal domain [sediment metagenome]|uniref:Protein containing ATPase, P-type cation-transporter, N-terminal domain n=1 Tax=sediment metagenome TaxID=749907 RepID=D9PLH2_9ZZZZ